MRLRSHLPLLTLLGCVSATALASSHREAPSIAKDPALDLTDVYTFRSEQSGHQVFIMNVSPAYQSYAGPNWYGFEDEAIYEMHVDNTGDAVEDVTYQFKFTTRDYRALGAAGLIVANFPDIVYDDAKGEYVGKILGAPPALSQTYSVTKIVGPRRSGTRTDVVTGALVAPPRIGPHTTDGGPLLTGESLENMYSAYSALANHAIKVKDTSKFFAGPRNDPFYVDLGAVFDRVSPRIPGVTGKPRDALKGANVLSIVFEVPDTDVFGAADNTIINVWATTSRPQAKVLRTAGQASLTGGGYVQVSRLGNPLVNEVVIKVPEKDKFNATEPKDDVANYAGYVIKPQLAYVLNFLYSGDKGATAANFITKISEGSDAVDANARADLVDVFVTGIKGVNRHKNSAGITAEGAIKAFTGSGDMIRVNKALTAGALGITADGDGGAIPAATPIEGWPLSGRVLRDDVVNTALTFLADCRRLDGLAILADTKLQNKYDLMGIWANHTVEPPTSGVTPANCLLDDFVTQPDATEGSASTNGVLASFPYIDLPHSSYYSRTEFPTYTYP